MISKSIYNKSMHLRGILNYRLISVLVLIFLFGAISKVNAQQICSGSYCANEYYFGTGGENELNSTNYTGRASTGSLGVGETSSTSYSTQAGYVTTQEEYLEMIVNTTNVNLGTLSASSASTGTGTFYVRAYTSTGYFVQTISPPPSNGAVTLTNLTSQTASSVGTEQFGINLVANTSPTTFGANPSQAPDSSFAYGSASTGYNTANLYKYVAGDTIATAPKGIGRTDYTISYLANASPISKGGEYTVDHVLVVVATF